jgi:hypothetical protein
MADWSIIESIFNLIGRAWSLISKYTPKAIDLGGQTWNKSIGIFSGFPTWSAIFFAIALMGVAGYVGAKLGLVASKLAIIIGLVGGLAFFAMSYLNLTIF